MWVWHVPALYDAAAEHTGIHVLEHLTFSARRLPLLVAPALAGQHATAARGHDADRLHAQHEGRRSASSGSCSRSPRTRSSASTRTSRTTGASTPDDDQALAGVDHGARAVDRDGDRARRAVHADARAVGARGAARGAVERRGSQAPRGRRRLERSPSVAGDRADQDRVRRRPRCPGRRSSPSARRPSPITAPSPIASGPCRRTPAPIVTSRPIQTGGSISVASVERRCPRRRARPRRPPRRRSSTCSSPRIASNVPCLAAPASEPTSFQYSPDLVDVERHVVLEQRREDVVRPVDERPSRGSSRRSPARTGRCRSCRGRTAPRPGPASPGSR